MMYEDVIRDFAERTRSNLRTIERLQGEGGEVYEATQLVNSMLGLLVFPREEFIRRVPRTPLDQLKEEGWPVPRVTPGFDQVSDLRELIRYLRNAIAHFNIEFIRDGRNEIRMLRVWNFDPRRGRKTWEAELGLAELRGIADRFTGVVIGDRG